MQIPLNKSYLWSITNISGNVSSLIAKCEYSCFSFYRKIKVNTMFISHICTETYYNTLLYLFPCGSLPAVRCPADLASPCPGCWPCGLAWASCCYARPRSTRPSSSTMWPGPVAPTSSPWVRVSLCHILGSKHMQSETMPSRRGSSSQLWRFERNRKRLLQYVRMICHGAAL